MRSDLILNSLDRIGQQFISPNNLEPVGLAQNLKILPEYLNSLGYESHLIGRWSQGFCSQKYLPTERGFKSFYGTWTEGGDHLNHLSSADPKSALTSLGYDFHEDESISLGNIGYSTVDLMVDKFAALLYQHFNIEAGFFSGFPTGNIELTDDAKPLFTLLSFDNLKLPLQPEEKFQEMYPYQQDQQRKNFLASVSNLDDAVGKMVANLKRFYRKVGGQERSIFEDTVIIFTSLSGGDSVGPLPSGSSNFPHRGGSGDLLEGGTRVPSFITNINTTGTVTTMFHISDWLPSIFTGIGGGNENNLTYIDGHNQLDVFRGNSEPLRSEILYDIANFNETDYTHVTSNEWPDNLVMTGAFGAALRVGDFKLSVGCSTRLGCARNYNATWEGNTSNKRVELYDLARDPEEKNDISEDPDNKATVDQLFKRIQFHLKRAVTPLHKEFESSGLPLYSFPPGQFYTGWCDVEKYENIKNSTAF